MPVLKKEQSNHYQHNKSLGQLGEQITRTYFLKNNYIFIEQNYVAGHLEIDLIFKKAKQIVFVEVKTRVNNLLSQKENPLKAPQTKRLKRALATYCLANNIKLESARLDLAIVLVNSTTKKASLRHYPDILR